MRYIGQTREGGILVEFGPQEKNVLEAAMATQTATSTFLWSMHAELGKAGTAAYAEAPAAGKPEATAAKPQPQAPAPKPPAAAAKPPAKGTVERKCPICGSTFLGRGNQKFCRGACAREHMRRYNRNWYERKCAKAGRPAPGRKPKKQPPAAKRPDTADAERKCKDCAEPTGNPKKVVCDKCAAKRIRLAQGGVEA